MAEPTRTNHGGLVGALTEAYFGEPTPEQAARKARYDARAERRDRYVTVQAFACSWGLVTLELLAGLFLLGLVIATLRF